MISPQQQEEDAALVARHCPERTVTIVGVDEVDVKRGQVSWLSPIARVLLKKRSGDVVTLATPSGEAEIEIIGVKYGAGA